MTIGVVVGSWLGRDYPPKPSNVLCLYCFCHFLILSFLKSKRYPAVMCYDKPGGAKFLRFHQNFQGCIDSFIQFFIWLYPRFVCRIGPSANKPIMVQQAVHLVLAFVIVFYFSVVSVFSLWVVRRRKRKIVRGGSKLHSYG